MMMALDAPQPCPLCGTMTEPDLDGDHLYYECPSDECVGYAWGWTRIGAEDDCAVGVPLAIRQQHSQFQPEDTAVNLGSTIGRRPGL